MLNTILAANPDLGGVYGVNDSMALGRRRRRQGKGPASASWRFSATMAKSAALESIEAGELTGTQYTDVYQQGRLAAAAATVLATGGVAGHGIRPAEPSADALCDCHQGKRWFDPTCPKVVGSPCTSGRGG